jgi:hypothetical protein
MTRVMLAFVILMAVAWPISSWAAPTTLPSCESVAANLPDESSALILRVPDFAALTADKLSDPRRCNVSRMVLAIHVNGALRDVYRPGTTAPDDRFFLTELTQAQQSEQFITPAINDLEQRVAAAYQADPQRRPVRILIFAHGGLVSQTDAVLNAEALAPMMIRDGYVPLFLIWNSDFFTSYGERLCCVSEGQKANKFSPTWFWNIPVRATGDVAASVARAPETYGLEFTRWKQGVIDRSNRYYYLASDDASRDCPYFGGPETCANLIFPRALADRPRDFPLNDDNFDRVGKTAEYALNFAPRVAVTAVGSQIGASAWDNMFRRTRIAFDNDGSDESCVRAARTASTASAAAAQSTDCYKGGFTRFFDALHGEIVPDRLAQDATKRYLLNTKDGRVPINIEFYGHSMGAIVGDELLRRYSDDFPWTRIVYMAAANSIRDFKLTAGPVIARRRIPFYSLSLHPLNETRELEVRGAVPEGSLLEWIDEMFEGPRTLDDRTLGSWKNLEASLPSWDPAMLHQLTARVFAVQGNLRTGASKAERDLFAEECSPDPAYLEKTAGLTCFPDMHGQFTGYSFWRPMYLIGSDRMPPEKTQAFLDAFYPRDAK